MKRIKLKKILVLIVIIYMGYTLISQQMMMIRIKSNLKNKQNTYAKLLEENTDLKEQAEFSKTETYIEKLARERLGLIKEGEVPVKYNGN